MAKKDDKGDKIRPEHTGSTAAEDEEFSLWLNRHWARGEPPQRVELWQMFGKNKEVRGEMIHHEDFKPGETLNIEQANKLANEIMAAAQNDCDSVRKESWYQLAVIDRNRKANPLTRRVGPLQPKRSYMNSLARMGHDYSSDDGGEESDVRNLELTHIKASFEETRWATQRNDRVLGDVLMLFREGLLEERANSQRLMGQVMDLFSKNLDAEDRRMQRELIMERERFDLGMKKELIRTARNLLPGFFGGGNEAPSTAMTTTNGHTNGHSNGATAKPDYGPSPERTLVDNFLRDVQEDGEEISIALFGDFKEGDKEIVQVTEGIFSFEQFKILLGVRAGHMPKDKLDELVPDFGHKNAVTFDQVKRAGAAGLSEAVGMALLEIVNLRKQARAAAKAASAPTPPNDSPTP